MNEPGDDILKDLNLAEIMRDERNIDAHLNLLTNYLNALIQIQLGAYDNYSKKSPLTPSVEAAKTFERDEVKRISRLTMDLKTQVQKSIVTLRIMKLVLKWAATVKDTEIIKATITKLQDLTKFSYTLIMLNSLHDLFLENPTAEDFIKTIADRIEIEADRNELYYRQNNGSTNGDFRTAIAIDFLSSIGEDDIAPNENETPEKFVNRIGLDYLNFILDLESIVAKAKR